MRKFSARWWVSEQLIQWRLLQACGEYSGGFAMFPHEPVFRLATHDRQWRFFRGETQWSLE